MIVFSLKWYIFKHRKVPKFIVVIHFGAPYKKNQKRENTKKLKQYWNIYIYIYIYIYINKKNIYLNAQEIVKDWLRKIKIYKIENLNIVFFTNEDLISKGKFNLRREIQNWMFKDSIETFQGLIEFNEGLI
jgi:hypothetical protein